MRRGGVVPPAHVALRAEGRRMRRPYCLRASLIVCAKMNHRILIGPRTLSTMYGVATSGA